MFTIIGNTNRLTSPSKHWIELSNTVKYEHIFSTTEQIRRCLRSFRETQIMDSKLIPHLLILHAENMKAFFHGGHICILMTNCLSHRKVVNTFWTIISYIYIYILCGTLYTPLFYGPKQIETSNKVDSLYIVRVTLCKCSPPHDMVWDHLHLWNHWNSLVS